MHEQTPIQRVRIYLGERDSVAGQPLYLAVLERLRREGATGATALRGVAGFGPGHRLRSAGAADLGQSPPVVIEWVDRAERIARVLPTLDDILPNALITVEDLRIHRAVLRSAGPFGERPLAEALDHNAATASPHTTLREAAELLVRRGQPLLPVLDEEERVVGVLGGADLAQRAGLGLHPRLLGALAPGEQAAMLSALPDRAVAEVMTAEPRTIYVEASIPQAIGMLVEWGLDALPVVGREGRFAGMFGVEGALRAALEARAPAGGRVRDAELPTTVRLVMQTAVPIVSAGAPLASALAQLLAAPGRFLVVMDGERPAGVLGDALVAGRLGEPLRAAWLSALRAAVEPTIDLDTELSAGDIAEPAPTIGAQTTELEAIERMLDEGHERLVVVGEDGRLEGLLARRALLRALAQESAG
jgi:CBS-domain-containing membrane protein